MATKVVEVLVEWGIKEKVVGCPFDTTASNTGIHTGCVRLLEELWGNPLLNLAASTTFKRELLLAACVQGGDGPSSGPTIQLFKRFREHSGPTSLMKIPKPSTTSSTEDRSRVRRGRSIDRRWREGSSRESPRDYRELCNCPSSISPETSVSRLKKPGAFPTPLDGKGNSTFSGRIRMSGPTCK
ncbi:hypothetical protein GWK47_015041 [Chionoecetes opilio]|uniref:Uncharacterized protein n=1 Tax=Chionoecetes opilio TaxID=41210 RepID=A0A8J4XSQ6_CHIOP|nr:hypothetical protein GWK47_015041 [Chionoecetes opilio]